MRVFLAGIAGALALTNGTVASAAEPEENLDCIILLAAAMNTVEGEGPKIGVASALGWFVGQYETQTGTVLGDDLVERAKSITPEEMQGVQQQCLPRMQAYGNRLSELGSRLVSEGEQER